MRISRTLRASVLWQPTDRLSIEPSFMYQEITQGGLSLIDSPPGTYANYQPYDNAGALRGSHRYRRAQREIPFRFCRSHLDDFQLEPRREPATGRNGGGCASILLGRIVISPAALEDDKSSMRGRNFRRHRSRMTNTPRSWSPRTVRLTPSSGYRLLLSGFESIGLFVDTPYTPCRTSDLFTQYQPTKILQNSLFGELPIRLSPI